MSSISMISSYGSLPSDGQTSTRTCVTLLKLWKSMAVSLSPDRLTPSTSKVSDQVKSSESNCSCGSSPMVLPFLSLN